MADTLEWWVLRDPYGAIGWVQSQDTISSWVVGRMAEAVARRDRENAITLAAQFSRPVRAAWLEAAGSSPAHADRFDARRPVEHVGAAETASAWVRTLVALPDRGTAGYASRADAAVRLAATDPAAAMDRALAIEAYWLRLDTMQRVAAVWAERAPADALAFVRAARELDPDMKSAIRSRVLEAWAVTDPGRALGFALGRDGQNLFFFDERGARGLARELAARQPHELLYAARGLPEGLVRSELLRFAIAGLVERDPPFAQREAALAAPGPEREQWLTAIRRLHPDHAEELGF